MPTLARLYYSVRHVLQLGEKATWSLFTGAALGVMSRSTLNAIDDLYYIGGEARRNGPIDYFDDRYNRVGLWWWEKGVIDRYFGAGGRVAVLAAGGGREVLALRKLGFDADGWECQAQLVTGANRLLAEEGFPAAVAEAPRDTIPPGDTVYTGAILGWGVYTLIQGRRRRVVLLRALRGRLHDDAPLLLSFFTRSEAARRFRVVTRIANVGRKALGRERVEVGDYLEPNYVHYFTERELRSELAEAGFSLELYQRHPYGHAIAKAVASLPPEKVDPIAETTGSLPARTAD